MLAIDGKDIYVDLGAKDGVGAGAKFELLHEIVATELDLLLPDIRPRASAADGTVENELCPVDRVTTTDAHLTTDPSEVDEAWWVPWAVFAVQADGADPLSSWGVRQVAQLKVLGPDPFAWAPGDPALLPSAARP